MTEPRLLHDAAALASLVREDSVHRDVYTDPALFTLEMDRLWARTWIYVGHTSQVPDAGDYLLVDLATRPAILVRQTDGSVRVLFNRCAHKGAKVVSAPTGNIGRYFRCPYHGWAYHPDGSLYAIPKRHGYDDTAFGECEGAKGMVPVRHVETYRGFVFARLSDAGPGFREFFGDSLSSIDNMADRSPEGELEIAGGCLRYVHDCNWKMFVENLNDTMHPMVVHESSAGTAKKLWAGKPAELPKPMAIEQFVPFASNYEFFDDMGVRVFENGHSYTGVNFSIHSAYSSVPGYEDRLKRAWGDARAADILKTARHNTVYYPSLTIKGAIQAIRVVRPVAVDRTVVESWTFRLKGAPDALLARTVMYTRLINSPMSVVGHDDRYAYRAIQEGLRAEGNDWVSLHRDFRRDEIGARDLTVNGLSEISMRNQFRAWLKYMAPDPPGTPA